MTDRRRYPRGSSAERGYGGRWRRYRERYLLKNPDCVYCHRAGRATPATVVDHREPHGGDNKKFWDPKNHQGLCATCHSAVKQTEERSGYQPGCDEQGNPLDPRHPWNKGKADRAA